MKKTIIGFIIIIIAMPLISLDLILLHTNDIRDVFQARGATFINPDFPPMLGGVYSFATAVKWEQEDAEKAGNIILLMDSGNFTVKHIEEDSITMDKSVDIFNYLHYDCVNLGIDEISSGFHFIEKNMNRFEMPLLLSNIKPKDKNVQLNTRDYVIFNEKGVRIGVFGLTTEYAVFDLRRHILKTVDIEREIQKAKILVNELKANRCDVIIGLTSIGFEHDMKLADEVPGIDVILCGYEGRGMRNAIESPLNHTIIFRGYGELSSYDKIVLELDEINNISGYKAESVTIFEEAFPSDPGMEEIMSKYE